MFFWVAIIHYIIILFKEGVGYQMDEDTGFNFTELPPKVSNDGDFKRQRQLYLAEREARKREAMLLAKKDAHDSSSDDQPPAKKQPFLIKPNQQLEGSNTDSSQNSPKPESIFRAEREKYKNQRLAHRQEAKINKRIDFGSSSSSDQESVPVHPKSRVMPMPEAKMQVSPRQPFKEEENQFGVSSLQLPPNKQKEGRGALLASVRLKDKHSDKKEARERYEVETPSKKGANIWIERWLEFKENSVQIGQRVIPIYDISKAKMIIHPTTTGSLKIKLTVKEEEVFLAANPKKMNDLHYLDQYYFIFAKIVTLKLQLMGKKPVPVSRIKSGISQQILKQARLAGKVRKSSFFGGWQQKIGVAGQGGLSIYKQGKEKAALTIPPGSVRQIWTRFQFQRDNLILKFLNNSSKLQLSVPLQAFLNRDNWLYQIYALTPR